MADFPGWQNGIRHPWPAHNGHCQTDVAIVGGGLTGVTTALMLSALGARVTLLEKRRLGDGATWGCLGQLRSLDALQRKRIEFTAGKDAAVIAARLNDESIAHICELIDRLGLYCGLTRYSDETFGLMPLPYLLGMAESASSMGCRIHEQSAVRQIAGHRLVTDHGSVTAQTIILATGVSLGCTQKQTGWDVVIRGAELKGTAEAPIMLGSGTAGRFLGCTIEHAKLMNGNFENCRISHASASMGHHDDFGLFSRCKLDDVSYSVGYWHKPVSLRFIGCEIAVGTASFLRTPLYAIGRVGFDGDKVVFTDPKEGLVEIIDFRENTNCPNPDDAKLAFANTSFAGQAASLIRVGGMSQLSKKPFKVWTRNLTMPGPAIPLFDAKKLPDHWTVKE